jgi:hypothetical protein
MAIIRNKVLVVPFQDKAFNPEWNITGCFLAYQLMDITKLRHQKNHKWIMELKLGWVNHNKMKKKKE